LGGGKTFFPAECLRQHKVWGNGKADRRDDKVDNLLFKPKKGADSFGTWWGDNGRRVEENRTERLIRKGAWGSKGLSGIGRDTGELSKAEDVRRSGGGWGALEDALLSSEHDRLMTRASKRRPWRKQGERLEKGETSEGGDHGKKYNEFRKIPVGKRLMAWKANRYCTRSQEVIATQEGRGKSLGLFGGGFLVQKTLREGRGPQRWGEVNQTSYSEEPATGGRPEGSASVGGNVRMRDKTNNTKHTPTTKNRKATVRREKLEGKGGMEIMENGKRG